MLYSPIPSSETALEERLGLHKKGIFPQHTMIIAIPFPKTNSFSSGLLGYPLGHTQAQNCASFFPDLEINKCINNNFKISQ